MLLLKELPSDFQKLENENIKVWEYGKGKLYGQGFKLKNIFTMSRMVNALCAELRMMIIYTISFHAVGGSDKVSNIAGLCYDCHYGPLVFIIARTHRTDCLN